MPLMVTGDQQGFSEFELRGNQLVCKCHGRVVITFDAEELARHHEQQRATEAQRSAVCIHCTQRVVRDEMGWVDFTRGDRVCPEHLGRDHEPEIISGA